jgi:hypothetical protein
MHKQIATIVLALAITSILSAQESTDKTIMIGTDLAPLAFGAPNGYFGLIHNSGKNEIGVGAFAGKDDDENLSFLGIYPSYRLYPSGKGKGIYVEAGLGLGFVNWDYVKEEVSAITFWPTVNLGYRLSWNFGLSVAPYVGGNYAIGKVEASDGTVKTFEDGSELTGSFGPSFGLELGYMF